jgi:hypothetical protein
MLAAAGMTHAQITFRGQTSASVPAVTATIQNQGQGGAANRNGCGTITPGLPGGTTAGDLLIAVVATGDDSTISMAGWNTLYNNIGANNEAAAIFWRIATGGDPRTITQTGNCNVMIGQIARYTGVDTQTPIGAGPSGSFQVAATVSSGQITVPYAGAMVVFTAHMNDDSSTSTLSGFSREFNSQTKTGNDAALTLYDNNPSTAPPYTAGPYTVTKSRGADSNQGVVFALRPQNSALVLNVPAGTAANDVLIASIATTPSTTTVTAPAGWTQALSTAQGAANSNRLTTFYRVATASEPASYTFTLDGTTVSAGAAGEMLAFTGVDTVSPINAQGGNVTASGLTQTGNAITTTVPQAMIVGAFEFASSPGAGNYNPTAGQGMVKALAQPSVTPASSSGVAIVMSYGGNVASPGTPQAGVGSTGAKSAVASGVGADAGAAQLFALRPLSTLAHYAISVASSTVANCDFAQVTISGHDTSHNLVAPPSGRTVTLSTSTASGVWQAGTVAGTGAWTPSGANNGSASYIWPGSETSFTVQLRQSAVVNLGINLNDGAAIEDAAEDPTISFVNSAFRISDGANGSASIPTQIAGKPSNVGFGQQTLYLQAVRTDNNTGACVSLFPINTDVSVQVGAQCNNPASCTQNLALTSSALSSNSAIFVPSGAFATSMNFRFTTANAEAPFVLNYGDAGQITLQFRAALPSPPANQFVSGTSNAFVVRPFGFAFLKNGLPLLQPIQHSVDGVTASALAAAGDDFSMTVAAYRWSNGQDSNNDGIPDTGVNLVGNGLTPNFAGTTNVSVTSNLPGVAPGTLTRSSGAATVTAAEWSGGVATINNWRYDEVGNVFLAASATGYLGDATANVFGNSGLDGTGAANGFVGRFIPKRFALSGVASPVTTRSSASCSPASSFTYMNERLQLKFNLTAQNASGATTQNYTGTYARLALTNFGVWSLGARDVTAATNLTARIFDPSVSPPAPAAPPTGTWNNGVASNVTITTAIQRNTPDNPDGPFQSLKFGIAPVDSDGVGMASFDLDVDNNGTNDHAQLVNNVAAPVVTDVRFGRLRLENSFGPENRDLPVSISAEYWDGAKFSTNANDNCTSIPASAIAMSFSAGANLAACETHSQNDPIVFSAGKGNLVLTAPGTGNNGSVLLTANLNGAAGNYCNGAASAAATNANLPYFLGRWDDTSDPDTNANTNYDDAPSARGAFGLYGSQPKNFIYFRENY